MWCSGCKNIKVSYFLLRLKGGVVNNPSTCQVCWPSGYAGGAGTTFLKNRAIVPKLKMFNYFFFTLRRLTSTLPHTENLFDF